MIGEMGQMGCGTTLRSAMPAGVAILQSTVDDVEHYIDIQSNVTCSTIISHFDPKTLLEFYTLLERIDYCFSTPNIMQNTSYYAMTVRESWF